MRYHLSTRPIYIPSTASAYGVQHNIQHIMALSLPKPFAQIPRARLLYPDPSSPIHPLQALTTSLNNSTTNPSDHPSTPHISLYAKRDDHSSPLACAGNKYRKLEYIIPDILNPANDNQSQNQNIDKTKVTTLVTEGAIQSNHTIQVASVAHKLNLEALIILHKQTGGGLASSADKNAFLRVGNVQIAKLLGAEVRMLEKSSTITTAGSHDPIPGILDELRAQGKVPYWIPSGASLHPLGGLGYARCAFEIAEQEKQLQTQSQELSLSGTGRFDYIFVACGSGSTIGGLIAGFKLLDKQANQHQHPPRKIIGILTSPTMPREYHEERVLRFARTAAGMIGLDPERDITMDDVHLDERFVGTAYGALDPEAKQALEMMARVESVIVDPVYTAKVVRGLVHWVQSGELGREWAAPAGAGAGDAITGQANALFIHTGGQSALGAYADID